MIQKLKWIQILQDNNTGVYSLSQQGLIDLIDSVDTLYSQQLGSEDNDHRIKNIYQEIINHFVVNTKADNYWADMPIWVSSYNAKNKAPFGEVVLRLTQYLGFYKKILTDNGLARTVVTHRDYRNQGHSEGTNKNVNSETPQIQLQEFDDMLQYVSQANKTEDQNNSTTFGDSDLTVESKSFDEQERNLKLVYYNDLCDYIRKIPHWLYSQYALDSLPATAIVEETFNYFKELYER